MMARIFINFRNLDGDWAALAIRNTLAERFGTDEVFLSSFSIPLATSFPDELLRHARDCDVLLAIIGPNWLTITGPDGRLKLGGDDDWVCREIATALAADRKVVPILLSGASRLVESDLPVQIAELARLQGCRLDRPHYQTDMGGLEQALIKLIPGLTPKAPPISANGLDVELRVDEARDHATVEVLSTPDGSEPHGSYRGHVGRLDDKAVARGHVVRGGPQKRPE